MQKQKLSKKGAALALVLVAVVILSVLGIGLLQMGFQARRQAVRTTQELAARAAADAGLTLALFEDNYQNTNVSWPLSISLYPGSSENFSVNVIPYDNDEDGIDDGYNITSTGYSGLITKVVNLGIRDELSEGPSGAKGHWTLDKLEQGTFADSSGNGYDGEAQGALPTEDARFGDGAAITDGQNDYIMTIVGDSGLTGSYANNQHPDFAAVAWVKPNEPWFDCGNYKVDWGIIISEQDNEDSVWEINQKQQGTYKNGWIDAVYEEQCEQVWKTGHNENQCEDVWVEEGHWESQPDIWVVEGHWESQPDIWVTEGHYEPQPDIWIDTSHFEQQCEDVWVESGYWTGILWWRRWVDTSHWENQCEDVWVEEGHWQSQPDVWVDTSHFEPQPDVWVDTSHFEPQPDLWIDTSHFENQCEDVWVEEGESIPQDPIEHPPVYEEQCTGDSEFEVFFDGFEDWDEWNDNWSQGNQDDWNRSSSRDNGGRYSAEVDGSANDAKLISKAIDLQGASNATISFWWYIEYRLDNGEYLAFDISTDGGNNWTEKARIRGNEDPEDSWQYVEVEMDDISSLRIRFRGKMDKSNEDAYVDNVKVTVNNQVCENVLVTPGYTEYPDPIWVPGGHYETECTLVEVEPGHYGKIYTPTLLRYRFEILVDWVRGYWTTDYEAPCSVGISRFEPRSYGWGLTWGPVYERVEILIDDPDAIGFDISDWHFVVGIYDADDQGNSTISLQIDNREDLFVTKTLTGKTMMDDNGTAGHDDDNKITIGGKTPEGGGGWWNGGGSTDTNVNAIDATIDEVRIYNRTLSAEEATSLMNNNTDLGGDSGGVVSGGEKRLWWEGQTN